MKKYRNKQKQEAFDDFRSRNLHDLEQFSAIWNRSKKNAKRIYNFGKHKEFANISERAKIFTIDEVVYKSRSYNNIMENSVGKDFFEKFQNAEVEIYRARTEEFMKEHGDNEFKYDGKTKTLNEWFKEYSNGNIEKEDMNEIIRLYKEENPDRIADSDGDELDKNGLYQD